MHKFWEYCQDVLDIVAFHEKGMPFLLENIKEIHDDYWAKCKTPQECADGLMADEVRATLDYNGATFTGRRIQNPV